MKTRVHMYLWAAAALVVLGTAIPARATDYPTTVLGLNPVAYYRLSESTPVPANIVTNLGSLGASENGLIPYPATGSVITNEGDLCIKGAAGVVGTCISFTNSAGGANFAFNSRVDVPWNAA